jgi:aspartate/methionine/tyrosine aminotransferase
MSVCTRLSPFGTTIFTEVSRLAAEHGAINLAQGFPDFDGPEHVKEAAIAAIRAGQGQYARMAGAAVLNTAVAGFLEREAGMRVDPDSQVTITAGCTEAIAASMLGLLNPGDEVILFEPYYDSYRASVVMAGGVPRFVTLRGPGFTFDPAELSSAVTARTRAIVVNTPQNPTGRVFTRAELQSIADVCLKHGLVAISDEVYEKLVYDGAEHLRIATLPGMAERTLTLSSLGKTFGLTGWKIGWAVGSVELTKAVRAAHQFLTFAVNTPMQHAAAAALNSPASYYAELVSSYTRKRDFLAGALRGLGFEFRDPEGSYFIYADHRPVSRRLGLHDDVSMSKHLIEHIGVAAIPPSVFYENKAEGSKYLRFAFCKKDETLAAAVERLNKLG